MDMDTDAEDDVDNEALPCPSAELDRREEAARLGSAWLGFTLI
jgi:hypothetical protein